MFIATPLKVYYGSRRSRMLLLRGHIALRWSAVLEAGGGYKHLAALRPIHNYTTTKGGAQ